MFKAILFDLDGTLLPLEMDIFLPQYFQALAATLQQEEKTFTRKLLASTGEMLAHDGSHTNQEVFYQDFFPRFAQKQEGLEALLTAFYQEQFPQLGANVQAHKCAKAAVEAAFAITDTVVIATNPIFPQTAIYERLKWAGVADFPYALVTSYEEMHWAKPNPHYYLEIAAKVGVEPEEALMIGNDVEEDLVAGEIGMKTFLVDELLIQRGDSLRSDWRGDLASCAALLQRCAKGEAK